MVTFLELRQLEILIPQAGWQPELYMVLDTRLEAELLFVYQLLQRIPLGECCAQAVALLQARMGCVRQSVDGGSSAQALLYLLSLATFMSGCIQTSRDFTEKFSSFFCVFLLTAMRRGCTLFKIFYPHCLEVRWKQCFYLYMSYPLLLVAFQSSRLELIQFLRVLLLSEFWMAIIKQTHVTRFIVLLYWRVEALSEALVINLYY